MGNGNPLPPAAPDKRALLARLLDERRNPAEVKHPLSFNQRSLWFMHRLAPDSSAYNVPYAFRVLSPLNVEALRRAFEQLVARHAILRTTYPAAEPVQVVHARQELDFAEIVTADERDTWTRVTSEAQLPFDLQQGPVLRVKLFHTNAAPVLLVTFHHIAYDLWSMMTFLSELGTLYQAAAAGTAPALPPVEGQYTDFVRWQVDRLAVDGDRLWEYWRERLSGTLPVLRLPADHPRPAVQSYRGAIYTRDIPAALSNRLSALARTEGATLFTVLLAAFQLFLHKCSGQDDILVGTPMAGRSRAEFERLLGYFLNTLPLRADFSANPTFRDALRGAVEGTRGALDHQDYPVELLVERLRPVRSAQHAPLFQAMFVLNQPRPVAHETEPTRAHPLLLEHVQLDLPTSQFEVSLELDQLPDRLVGRWEYNTDILSQSTVAEWAGQFEALAAAIVDDPDGRIDELIRCAAEPRTDAEQLVADVYRTVLGVDRVTLDDTFLSGDGDPDAAARIAMRLSAVTGLTVPLTAVFQGRSVAGVAAVLERLLIDELPAAEGNSDFGD